MCFSEIGEKQRMKGNNGSGNNESRDSWETPQELWNKLNKQYNFTFDCCSNGINSKCNSWTSNFEMWVSAGIKHICWMNPPFSKAEVMFKHFYHEVEKGVCIYRCDNMETKLWQDIILKSATWVFIPKCRISYEGMEGKGSRFPSALIGYNINPPKGLTGHTLIIGKER